MTLQVQEKCTWFDTGLWGRRTMSHNTPKYTPPLGWGCMLWLADTAWLHETSHSATHKEARGAIDHQETTPPKISCEARSFEIALYTHQMATKEHKVKMWCHENQSCSIFAEKNYITGKLTTILKGKVVSIPSPKDAVDGILFTLVDTACRNLVTIPTRETVNI